MSSIQKLNLFLVVIIFILAALKFLPEETTYNPITAIAPQDITSIAITGKQRQLVFNKDRQTWLLQSAPEKSIDQESIEKLLGILKTHSYRQFEKSEANLSAFALNTPLYQLKLDELLIHFGSTDPVQDLRYILLEDKIHLINDMYLQFFLADENFFLKQAATQ